MKPVLVAFVPNKYPQEVLRNCRETLINSTEQEYHVIVCQTDKNHASFKMYICKDATNTNIETLQHILINEK